MEMDRGWIEPERVRPLKRAEYDRLVALGAFDQERVELLRGVLVRMSPQGPSHAGVVPVPPTTNLRRAVSLRGES